MPLARAARRIDFGRTIGRRSEIGSHDLLLRLQERLHRLLKRQHGVLDCRATEARGPDSASLDVDQVPARRAEFRPESVFKRAADAAATARGSRRPAASVWSWCASSVARRSARLAMRSAGRCDERGRCAASRRLSARRVVLRRGAQRSTSASESRISREADRQLDGCAGWRLRRRSNRSREGACVRRDNRSSSGTPWAKSRGDQVIQLGQTAAAGQVGRDRERRLAAEDVFDEAGQVAACPDIDEQAKAVGVHGLDRLAERHGLSSTARRRARGSRRDRRASARARHTNRSERGAG